MVNTNHKNYKSYILKKGIFEYVIKIKDTSNSKSNKLENLIESLNNLYYKGEIDYKIIYPKDNINYVYIIVGNKFKKTDKEMNEFCKEYLGDYYKIILEGSALSRKLTDKINLNFNLYKLYSINKNNGYYKELKIETYLNLEEIYKILKYIDPFSIETLYKDTKNQISHEILSKLYIDKIFNLYGK